MRNVNVSLGDEAANLALVWAAEHNTSLSRMLGELLEFRMAEQDAYAAAKSEYLAVSPGALKAAGGRYLSREGAHVRSWFCRHQHPSLCARLFRAGKVAGGGSVDDGFMGKKAAPAG